MLQTTFNERTSILNQNDFETRSFRCRHKRIDIHAYQLTSSTAHELVSS